MILDLTAYKARQALHDRLRSDKPYCGPCFDASGVINDLYGVKRYDGPNTLACEQCGEEFSQ